MRHAAAATRKAKARRAEVELAVMVARAEQEQAATNEVARAAVQAQAHAGAHAQAEEITQIWVRAVGSHDSRSVMVSLKAPTGDTKLAGLGNGRLYSPQVGTLDPEKSFAAQGISKGATLSLLPRIIIGGMESSLKGKRLSLIRSLKSSGSTGAPASVTAVAKRPDVPSTARIKVADSGVFLALDVLGEAGAESSVKWEELAALWRNFASMGLLPGVDVAWCEVQPMTAPTQWGVDVGPHFSVVSLPGKPTTDHCGKEDSYQIVTKRGRDTHVLTDEMRAKAQGLAGQVYELNLNSPRISFLLGRPENDALTNGPVMVTAKHEAVREVLNSIRAELGLGPFSAEHSVHTTLCKLTGFNGDHAALREQLAGWPWPLGDPFPKPLSSLAEALGGRGEAPQLPEGLHLPPTCTPKVVNAALRVASKVATKGVGEKQPAKGFLIIIGEREQLMGNELGLVTRPSVCMCMYVM